MIQWKAEKSPAIQKGGKRKPHLERLLNNLRQACCAELRLRGVPAPSPSLPSPPSLPALHFSDSLRRRRRSSAAPLCHSSRLCCRPLCRNFWSLVLLLSRLNHKVTYRYTGRLGATEAGQPGLPFSQSHPLSRPLPRPTGLPRRQSLPSKQFSVVESVHP